MKSILYNSGNEKWADWINQDINEWEINKTTKHHLSGFGGIGSINDVYISNREQNFLFQNLKSISYAFAKNNGILDEGLKKRNYGLKKRINPVQGWGYSKCEQNLIAKSEYENYKYEFAINHIIQSYVNAGQFDFTSILADKKDILTNVLLKVDKAFNNSKIKLVDSGQEWSSYGKDCLKVDIESRYWELKTFKDGYKFIPAIGY